MGSSPAKKADEQSPELLDQPSDRELRLARNFEDPELGELIPGLSGDQPEGSVVHEALSAVQALVQEARPQLTIVPNGGGKMAGSLFQLVACERTFDNLVEGVLEALMGAVQASAGSVLEFDRESREFFFRAISGGGDPAKVKAFRVPANKGIVGHVAETGAPLLLADLEEDEKQLRAISLSVGFEARSCLAVPLVVGGQLYGVVELFNRRDGKVFAQSDLEQAMEGAAMAAKVLEVRFVMSELARRMR